MDVFGHAVTGALKHNHYFYLCFVLGLKADRVGARRKLRLEQNPVFFLKREIHLNILYKFGSYVALSTPLLQKLTA
jgi:hypothetical protein